MDDILSKPLELTDSDLDAVAGGFGNGSLNSNSFNFNGSFDGNLNGNNSGNGGFFTSNESANGNNNGNFAVF